MHYKNPRPIPNPNLNSNSNLVPYYPKMTACEDPDPYPIESPELENPLMSLLLSVLCDGLKDQSQFNIPPLIQEKTNTGVNNEASNGAQTAIHGRSVGGTNGDGTTTNCGTESVVSPPTNMMDVLSNFLPAMIIVSAIYANKKALQRHLCRFAISNHFQYKVRTPKKNILHIVCLDDNCKWTICTTKRHKFVPNYKVSIYGHYGMFGSHIQRN